MKVTDFSKYILILTILAITTIVYFNFYIKNFFNHSKTIAYNLTHLKGHELDINYELLKSSIYLYENNDNINKKLKIYFKTINDLLNNKFLKQNYPITYKNLQLYKQIAQKKKEYIFKFLIVNNTIKNSITLISNIISREVKMCNDKKYLNILMEINTNILFSKNAIDKDFIQDLKYKISQLKKYSTENKQLIKLNKILVKTIENFINNFLIYKKLLQEATNPKNIKFIDKKILKKYFIESSKIEKRINILLIILAIFMAVIAFMINFLHNLLNKEYKKVAQAKQEIEKMYLTSTLTNLPNRAALNKELDKYSTLLLFNIDRFQHINDIYGNKIGDKVLQKTAKILKEIAKDAKVYHLGGDEFAIVYKEIDNPYKKAQEIIEYFKNHPIEIDDIKISIQASIGISDKYPQLEKADLILKEIKNNKKTNIKVYSEDLRLEEKIKDKMQKAEFLRKAIENDLIIPIFQPIINNQTLQIWKYEALARIKDKENLISIFPYLEIAKETHLYKQITLKMFKKVYEKFKNRSDSVSFNLSTEDIVTEETYDFIMEIIKNDVNFASRLTFEILESESIQDYSIVKNFIDEVKNYGVCIAIDDFGSGYSNFEHLINLDIDIIKIDGSLIKKITNNDLIVKTIVNFCKEAHIKSVAEFVSNEEIFNKVKELGIDFSQGFYLGKPTTL